MKRLTALRQNFPILRRNRFYTGEYNEELGIKDLTWSTPMGLKCKTSIGAIPT